MVRFFLTFKLYQGYGAPCIRGKEGYRIRASWLFGGLEIGRISGENRHLQAQKK